MAFVVVEWGKFSTAHKPGNPTRLNSRKMVKAFEDV